MPAPEDDIMPIGERFELPFLVPYYCQFCSPELVLDIISGRVRAEDDPRWAKFGARTKRQYAYWAWRACGIACLKMAIEALGGPMRPMMYWIEAALAIDGFLQERRAQKGKPSGWIHRSLAELGRQNGLVGECRAPVDTEEIARCLDRRQVVIASVSHELGEWGPVTRNTGHMVVVHGYSRLDGLLEALLVNNPSGRYPELRQNCWIPEKRFSAAFSGRIILFASKKNQRD